MKEPVFAFIDRCVVCVCPNEPQPNSLNVVVKDGRKFTVDLTTGMQETVFFHGVYEKAITAISRELIAEGETCIDVGANFGWFTTFFSVCVGPTGFVHAFEPVPRMFGELKRNCDLLGDAGNVFINNLALGDSEGNVVLRLIKGEATGHASLASRGGDEAETFECRMITLDSYLDRREIKQVDFVKVDIEGAELMFLKGAQKIFDQPVPPIILMEMALAETKPFGYLPDDLVRFIGERGEYAFYKIDETHGRLKPISGFDVDDIGANVFCIPADASDRVKTVIQKYLET